ncbi:uncharacterized protein E0L32_004659 [Thyridium curvatum]|uniref:Nicotinamide N-methyltransferase n=1 Tax=Thyridium curvatum TaxID=1093900 RepID=A0A507BDT8_9PEZI|nr:uncharacterized protein E0L32_004659 [Thyridium curvatum]TPX15101.1 hypothetical protein E0L32_004659 [Thyridium curvatum]
MALVSRIALSGPPATDPEDFLSDTLGVVFPDDVMNQHGDAEHGLVYTSPYLPKPLNLSLADPDQDEDRRLFSHYLWNSSLLMAELVEAGALRLGDGDRASSLLLGNSPSAGGGDIAAQAQPADGAVPPALAGTGSCSPENGGPAEAHAFDVTGLSTLELGAGTALPSILAALLGARRVAVTDYPADSVVPNMRANVRRNVQASFSPLGTALAGADLVVEGHAWGEVPPAEGNPLAGDAYEHVFDRVIACDCLWMPWQHQNLRASIDWFLARTPSARCWVVAGFHTGRDKLRDFFSVPALEAVGLVVEKIWERDCEGFEREWAWDWPGEDITARKRWQVVAILKRTMS